MVKIYKPYDKNRYTHTLHRENTKDENSRKIIYSADLVKQINESLGLKYRGKSSYTIRKIEYREEVVLTLCIKKEKKNAKN